uniref:Programmed cell death 7 n=1 Tax=Xiphophorus couchianus TaxID=32473 RepID=A0A3B5MJT1_9TELE
MDGSYQHRQADAPQHHVFGGGIQQPASEHPNHTAPPWIPPTANFPAPPPGGAGFGTSRFPLPYGYDPYVPPPNFVCPPPGHFPGMAPPAPGNTLRSPGVPTFQAASQQLGAAPFRIDCGLRQREDYRDGGLPYRGSSGPPQPHPLQRDSSWETAAQPEDEEELQRRQDRQWLTRFLQSRGGPPDTPQEQRSDLGSVPVIKEALYGTARLLSRLKELCLSLQHNLHSDSGWSESYQMALHVKREVQAKVQKLTDSQSLDLLKVKVARIEKRRARRLRAKKDRQVEQLLAEELSTEKEASIDKWRMRQIQKVEEKKKEQELKLSADAVLCEVRRKQADVKRMQDIMRSLEKLRRLRKEAASRKGRVKAFSACDEAFSGQLEQLRDVMKRRTELYSAEEKALMVMLEGEQQEERRREQERRFRKERERQLERKRRVDSMLFGDEPPADGVLQPFTDYYSQAEHSLQALRHIRRDWDVFLVAADHPDGSGVPQGWVLPDSPSDQNWASALQAADADGL